MKKHFSFAFMLLALIVSFSLSALGQETTGGLEITSRDPNGAVVPNVSVTISASSSGTAGFKRTATTGDDGSVRIVAVPPGLYNITAAATAGFAEKTVEGVQVVLGKATPVIIDLGITSAANVEVSGDVQPIDASDTKVQTNISAQLAELLPKGTNFSSILKVSPAARPEPRSGQFQIDGASGSENTFIIDGQEVTNVRTGTLDSNSNLPFQMIQEVQVKTSGFEAEFGGATGGVINIVTKGGSNSLRGEFGINFRPSSFNALGGPTLRRREPTLLPEFFHQKRDHYAEVNPSLNLGGPIIKDRWWFYGYYNPQRITRTRTINYVDPINRTTQTFIPQTYEAFGVNEYTSFRMDAQPLDKLRVTGTWTWNPVATEGAIPAWTTSLFTAVAPAPGVCSAPICQAGHPELFGANYLGQTGGRRNSQSITGQAVYTITNNFIISGRAGHYFLNDKLGTYGIGDVTIPRILCSGSSTQQFPAGFGCIRGQSNGITAIENTLYDATTRNTVDIDATFLFNGFGRHELKGGYQHNGIGNQVNLRDTDQIILRYGQPIGAYSGTGIPSTPGAVGSGSLIVYNESGDVSSANEGLFIQDRWQIAKRLTLNLGLRTEREDVPSFTPGAPGIKFDFQDKMAPRLGVSYDLTGDGKTVIKAFYGWFYDRFKYELPRGSFGGATYHQMFYEIFPGDTLSSFTVGSILGSGGPIPGGACSGALAPAFGKVRCDIDFRIASNTSLPLDEAGGIDPNIKAFRQSEFSASFERDLGRNFVFKAYYKHKQVDHAVEDAGFPNSQGSEFYIIGNPGEGLYKEIAEGFGLQALKPERVYDALEVSLDRRFANDFFFNVNYTFSKLKGNYSGLASSDEEGRLSPNVNRYFDQPHAGWTMAGGPDNGVLPTDRPHVLNFYGAYVFDWNKRFGMGNQSTELNFFGTFQSGTPLTSFVTLNLIDFIVATKRGDMGRTPMFKGFDVALRHRVRFGRDDRFTIVAETDVLNVFNWVAATNKYNFLNVGGYSSLDGWDLVTPTESAACEAANNYQPCYISGYKRFQLNGSPQILADATNAANIDPIYNQPDAFQAPRSIRFGLRLLF